MIFAGVLIVLELDKGTLTIESELDDVPIRIMQGEKVVKSLTVSREGKTTRIAAGTYLVEIGQEFDKAVVVDGGVVLSRGSTEIVKVTQKIADTATTSSEKTDGATELEGIWHLESAIDSGGKPRKLELYDHWTFRGHRLLCEFATEGHWACDVEIDSTAKTIRFLKDGKDLLSSADYVLAGDQLTIDDQRPHKKVFRRGRAENAENEEISVKQVKDDGVFVTIPLKAEWVPEEWLSGGGTTGSFGVGIYEVASLSR